MKLNYSVDIKKVPKKTDKARLAIGKQAIVNGILSDSLPKQNPAMPLDTGQTGTGFGNVKR